MKRKLLQALAIIFLMVFVSACGDVEEEKTDKKKSHASEEREKNKSHKNEENDGEDLFSFWGDHEDGEASEKEIADESWRNRVVASTENNVVMNLSGEKITLDDVIDHTWISSDFDGLFYSVDEKLYVVEADLEPTCLTENLEVSGHDAAVLVAENGIIAYYSDKNITAYDAIKHKSVFSAEVEGWKKDWNFTLSADGSTIAYYDGSDVVVCEIGGDSKNITFSDECDLISVSNDGQVLFFLVKDGTYDYLYTYTSEYGTTYPVSYDPIPWKNSFGISGDGKHIVYVSDSSYENMVIASPYGTIDISGEEDYKLNKFSIKNSFHGATYPTGDAFRGLVLAIWDEELDDVLKVVCNANMADDPLGNIETITKYRDAKVAKSGNTLIYSLGGELFKVNIEKTGIDTQTIWDGDKIKDFEASDELDLILFMTEDGSAYAVEDFGEAKELETIGADSDKVKLVVDENHNRFLYLYEGSVYSVSTEAGSLQCIEKLGNNIEYLECERGGIFALTGDGTLYYIDGDKVLTVTEDYDNSVHIYMS